MDTGMRPYDAKPHQSVVWFSMQWLTEIVYLQFHCPELSVKAVASTLCDVSDQGLSLSTLEPHLGDVLHRRVYCPLSPPAVYPLWRVAI